MKYTVPMVLFVMFQRLKRVGELMCQGFESVRRLRVAPGGQEQGRRGAGNCYEAAEECSAGGFRGSRAYRHLRPGCNHLCVARDCSCVSEEDGFLKDALPPKPQSTPGYAKRKSRRHGLLQASPCQISQQARKQQQQSKAIFSPCYPPWT